MIDWDAEVIGPLMGVFGEPAIYTPLNGAAFPITGVFDNAYLKEVMFEDATTGVTTVHAVFGVQVSQFSVLPAQNGLLVVPSVNSTYVVVEARFDGHGAAKLILSKVSSP